LIEAHVERELIPEGVIAASLREVTKSRRSHLGPVRERCEKLLTYFIGRTVASSGPRPVSEDHGLDKIRVDGIRNRAAPACRARKPAP
jgi:hypothetical protein